MNEQSLLKGNYVPKQEVFKTQEIEDYNPTEEFEKKALAKLGGSICFVRRKAFLVDPEQSEQ